MSDQPSSDQIVHIRQLINHEQWEEAFRDLGQLLQVFPKNLYFYSERIFMEGEYGNEEGLKEDSAVISRIAAGSAYDFFAQAMPLVLKDPDKAVELLGEAIQLDPTYERAWYMRGSIYSTARNFGLAVRDFEQAVRIDPDHLLAVASLGQASTLSGQYRKAIKALAGYMSSPFFRDDLPAYHAMSLDCAMVAAELDRKIDARSEQTAAELA